MEGLGRGPSDPLDDAVRHRALAAASRVRILALVRRAGDGLTAADVAEATGLHANTVRAHLDQLVDARMLIRRRRPDGS
ncbi:MAG: helix-turn-helix domain-containing protein, partial [Frankia sp.]|nr:helix-turn-helix domain-containing protein [Frankia sp.]